MNFKYFFEHFVGSLSYTSNTFLKNPENWSSVRTQFPISFKSLLKIFYSMHTHNIRVCAATSCFMGFFYFFFNYLEVHYGWCVNRWCVFDFVFIIDHLGPYRDTHALALSFSQEYKFQTISCCYELICCCRPIVQFFPRCPVFSSSVLGFVVVAALCMMMTVLHAVCSLITMLREE